jgi:hypothetical protein
MRKDPPEVIAAVVLETLGKLSEVNHIDLNDVKKKVTGYLGEERKDKLKRFLRKIEEVL